jgi:ElaB/YqjD/DUF883 family membrane-anchored ribosome-binding protein
MGKWNQSRDWRWFVQRVNAEGLVQDVAVLVIDLDELLKATEDNASEAALNVRERIEGSLQTAKRCLAAARICAVEEAKNTVRSADDYVRDNAWKAMGLAAGDGFLLGAIVRPRSERRRK